MIIDIVLIGLLILSAISKAMKDTLQFHYSKSIFSKIKKWQAWLNPDISWLNKYKNNDSSQGPKFIGSTTFLVWLTDAWHFVQKIEYTFLFIAIFFYTPLFNGYIEIIILYFLFTCTFELFYGKIFLKKK